MCIFTLEKNAVPHVDIRRWSHMISLVNLRAKKCCLPCKSFHIGLISLTSSKVLVKYI